jgi:hypothetical protein
MIWMRSSDHVRGIYPLISDSYNRVPVGVALTEGVTCQLFFFAFCRGVFQYGLLHFGHTFGSSVVSRGTQVCWHRSH